MLRSHGNRGLRAVLQYSARPFAAYVGDLALQTPHARLARVALDQLADAGIAALNLLVGQASGLALLTNQEALGDFQLFQLGVTGEPQNLHAILQGGRNGMPRAEE